MPRQGPRHHRRKILSDLRSTRQVDIFKRLIKKYDHRPVIISEGDSWFAHPLRTNTINHIQKMGRFNLLRLETSGHEIVEIMSGKQKRKLRDLLDCYPVDLLLFSGGGNDIVGEDFLPLIKDRRTVSTWEDAIHKTNFNLRLQQIKNAYKELINIRNANRPSCTIMTHGYDYPIPSDVGARFAGIKITGPWMKPYMVQQHITLKSEQKKIAKWLIQKFNEMLIDLEGRTQNFIYVKTPETLTVNEWGDEIHPTNAGFKKIANKFKPKLKQLFPNTTIK